MTGFDLHIPTLETERLILRAPRLEDAPVAAAFYGTDRSRHVGGPTTDRVHLSRAFGSVAGLLIIRGYSMFCAELKSNPGTTIGYMGPYEPLVWPEMEFGWTLFDPEAEGQGYVTEAMRRLIPWTWSHTGKDTALSFIDEDNAASIHVARALGAVRDETAEAALNGAGGVFENNDSHVTAWRHQRTAWEAAA